MSFNQTEFNSIGKYLKCHESLKRIIKTIFPPVLIIYDTEEAFILCINNNAQCSVMLFFIFSSWSCHFFFCIDIYTYIIDFDFLIVVYNRTTRFYMIKYQKETILILEKIEWIGCQSEIISCKFYKGKRIALNLFMYTVFSI